MIEREKGRKRERKKEKIRARWRGESDENECKMRRGTRGKPEEKQRTKTKGGSTYWKQRDKQRKRERVRMRVNGRRGMLRLRGGKSVCLTLVSSPQRRAAHHVPLFPSPEPQLTHYPAVYLVRCPLLRSREGEPLHEPPPYSMSQCIRSRR